MLNHNIPKHLYKIISVKNWLNSQNKELLDLESADDSFIHFSTKDQLDRIILKYWSNVDGYIQLQINVQMLPGKLVFESNPGGSNKYYHLYNGYIPMESVVESTLKKRAK